jgi:hypothetical protein
MAQRMQALRRTIGWFGRCRLDDEPSDWARCRAVDISVDGVGLEIFGHVPRDPIGRPITVEIELPASDAITVVLTGVVKYTGPGADGSVWCGIEFVGLCEEERWLLDTMGLLQFAQ